MATSVAGKASRGLLYGKKVDRATAVLPATTQAAIFNVLVGRVLILGLVGEFTVAASATATTVKVTGNPTTGTDVDFTSATAVTSKEIGAQMTLPPASGSALIVKDGGAGGQIQSAAPYIAAIGTVDLVTSATNTGSAKWSILYIPLDDGAYVTAA